MASLSEASPLLRLPRELRDSIYRELYRDMERSTGLHIHICPPSGAVKQQPPGLKRPLGLIHTSRQLRQEALPELLARLKLTLHPGPASGLDVFTARHGDWLPHIRRLCLADADVFLGPRGSDDDDDDGGDSDSDGGNGARKPPDRLRALLAAVSRQAGGALRELGVALPRPDWNSLAGCGARVVLSQWLFREVLRLRGLEAFVVCRPPERRDRPRWGRKPSQDVVARRMSEQKWAAIEELIAGTVTRPVGDVAVKDEHK